MRLGISNATGEKIYTNTFYPDDVNDMQTFELNMDGSSTLENVRKLEMIFDKSSDFFGRIIIYHLEMYVD